jgi:pimeloyl-ACP methyl ester carboxylesterase
MKTTIFSGVVVISTLFFSCTKQIEYGQYIETKCLIEISEELASSGKFSYGYMTVPEFHNTPGSKPIELAVAVFKCRQDSALYEPLVLNSGGPGMSNMEDFIPTLDGPFGDLILNERDAVIIELRGLKYARPNLQTPELDKLQIEMLDEHLTAAEVIRIYSDTIEAIQKRFADEGINLSAYNYWETASDVAFVMEQLGYEKYFVFGSSAGTILAQYLLMDHSEHLAGLVLNAVVDIGPGFNNMYVACIDKLESLFMEVERTEKYTKAYPDLKKRFLNTLDALNESPDLITVNLPGQEGTYDIVLNGDRISLWLFSEMYWNTQLPLSIHKIINRDYSELIDRPGFFFPMQTFSNGSSWSMILNGWPDPTAEQVPTEGEYKAFVEGMSTMIYGPSFMMKMRDIWQVDYLSDQSKPMATNVPTLMLNGEEDIFCLSQHAQELSDSFERSYCYIFKGIAHSPVDAGPCGIMLIKQFLDNPLVEPDASCLEDFKNEYEYVLP